MDMHDRQELLVVNFFRTADGRLNCRIRDAITKEHWIVRNPLRLHGLLQKSAAAVVLAASVLTGCTGGLYVPAVAAVPAARETTVTGASLKVTVALSASSISPGSASVKIALETVDGKRVPAKLRRAVVDTLTGCAKGCRVAGPLSPPGTDRYSISIFDAAGARGNVLAGGTATAKISTRKRVIRAALGKIPAFLTFGAAPALTAGATATAALSVLALDADRNAIAGRFATPIALSDDDTSDLAGGTSLSLDGGAATRSALLTNSTQTVTVRYGGLAIAPVTVSAIAGAATGSTALAPSLGNVGYSGPLVSGTPEIDLYNATPSGAGYQAAFSLTEPGWSGGGFSHGFTYATGGNANNCASFSISPSNGGATFGISVASNPVAGACTLTLTGAVPAEQLAVRLTYTSSGVGVFLER